MRHLGRLSPALRSYIQKNVPLKNLFLHYFSILLLIFLTIYLCVAYSRISIPAPKEEKEPPPSRTEEERPPGLHTDDDKCPECVPFHELIDSEAEKKAPVNMFHEHPYERTPIVLLAAYEYATHIVVTLQNDGYIGMRVYCHYRNENFEKMGEPSPGFVYPQYAVSCCKRKGAFYVSITEFVYEAATDFVPAQNRMKNTTKYELSMCMAPMYGFSSKWLLLTELVEHSKLQGVEHFYMYVKELDDYSRRVLNSYVESGDVEVIHFNEAVVRGGDWWQHVSIEDCMARSRHESKYIVMQDIDERFTPMIDTNLKDYVSDYFKTHPDIGIMSFRQLWILRDKLPPSTYKGINTLAEHLPTLKFHNSSAMTPPGHAAKNVLDPLKVLSMGVHSAYVMYPGYDMVFVPPEDFTIRHYRDTVESDWLTRVLPITIPFGDYQLTEYPMRLQSRLLANVKEKLDKVYLNLGEKRIY